MTLNHITRICLRYDSAFRAHQQEQVNIPLAQIFSKSRVDTSANSQSLGFYERFDSRC